MPATVLFLDVLPLYLQDRLKPFQDDLIQYSERISGYWTTLPILNSLFAYAEEDYYQWRDAGGVMTLALEQFVDSCLEWVDTQDVEDGMHDAYFVIESVAKESVRGELTVNVSKLSAQDAIAMDKDITERSLQLIRSLVQDAIAQNQPLPSEE